MMKNCTTCDHPNRDTASFCAKCGNPLHKRIYVLARCTQTRQYFGMTFEERPRGSWQWYLISGIPLPEERSKQGEYDRLNNVVGSFFFDNSKYKGCPYCQAMSFYQARHCNNQLACWNGMTNPVPCAWCGETITISGTISKVNISPDF